MGVADNPLRRVLNYASEHFLAGKYPVLYFLTVIGAFLQGRETGPSTTIPLRSWIRPLQ